MEKELAKEFLKTHLLGLHNMFPDIEITGSIIPEDYFLVEIGPAEQWRRNDSLFRACHSISKLFHKEFPLGWMAFLEKDSPVLSYNGEILRPFITL